MSEVMPMQIRARGNAFATGIGNWLVRSLSSSSISLAKTHTGLHILGTSLTHGSRISGLEVLLPLRRFVQTSISSKSPLTSTAWNICITFPVVFFFFKETKQVSLEDIDLLFGERALGTLPDDLHKEGAVEHHEMHGRMEGLNDGSPDANTPVVANLEDKSARSHVEKMA
jgi:hypothetical protein